MATVTKTPRGYEFAGLSLVGMRLVNEFQRHHPELCEPTLQPQYRYVRLGSPEQNLLLERLVFEVTVRDPEQIPPTVKISRRPI